MQCFRRIVVTAFTVVLVAPSGAWAQQTHVINQSALDQAVQQRVSQEQSDREALRTFLQNPQVKDVAAKAGLPIERAVAAVSTLQGDELRQAAGQARAVNQDLAGGTTVVITTTTIIIILLIILIIVLVA